MNGEWGLVNGDRQIMTHEALARRLFDGSFTARREARPPVESMGGRTSW